MLRAPDPSPEPTPRQPRALVEFGATCHVCDHGWTADNPVDLADLVQDDPHPEHLTYGGQCSCWTWDAHDRVHLAEVVAEWQAHPCPLARAHPDRRLLSSLVEITTRETWETSTGGRITRTSHTTTHHERPEAA